MKNFYLFILVFLCWYAGAAQQESQFTQYMYNPMSINPGYTGSREVLTVSSIYRNQWVGVEGAPETFNFSAHSPLGLTSLANLGLDFTQDRIGISTQKSFSVNFAYILPLDRSEDIRLSLGIKAGAENLDLALHKLTIADINDSYLANLSEFSPVLGLGAFLYTDEAYLGVSSPNLLHTKKFNEVSVSTYTNKAHIYFLGGYVFPLENEVQLKPAFLIKAVSGAPLAIDLSMNIYFLERWNLGASYRLNAAFTALAGFRITDELTLGYAYDYETTTISKYSSGSHEVFLQFELWSRYRNRFRCF